jgi:hypothetical protein
MSAIMPKGFTMKSTLLDHGALMTSNEKKAWVSLLAALLVFCPFHYMVFVSIGVRALNSQTALSMFFGAVGISIVVNIILSIVFGYNSKENFIDERDRHIIMRSNQIAYWVLTIGVALLAVELIGLPDWIPFSIGSVSQMAIAQIMLVVCTTSNLAKDISRIVYYRRAV